MVEFERVDCAEDAGLRRCTATHPKAGWNEALQSVAKECRIETSRICGGMSLSSAVRCTTCFLETVRGGFAKHPKADDPCLRRLAAVDVVDSTLSTAISTIRRLG
jgi:hypothetical protein